MLFHFYLPQQQQLQQVCTLYLGALALCLTHARSTLLCSTSTDCTVAISTSTAGNCRVFIVMLELQAVAILSVSSTLSTLPLLLLFPLP
jgi:hypothetical protein